VKSKPEKNSGLNRIQTHDLCNTSAEVMGSNLVQAGIFFSGFNFTTAQVVYNCNDTIKFISFSAVKIYDFSYIHLKIPYVIFLAQVNAKILACLWWEANF